MHRVSKPVPEQQSIFVCSQCADQQHTTLVRGGVGGGGAGDGAGLTIYSQNMPSAGTETAGNSAFTSGEEPSSSSLSSRRVCDQVSAHQFISRGFRAGVPIASLFSVTEALYGDAAWSSAPAQTKLLAHTVNYIPSEPPLSFNFGTPRHRRFVRALLDVSERIPGAACSEDLISLAHHFATCTNSHNNPTNFNSGSASPSGAVATHLSLDLPCGRSMTFRATTTGTPGALGLRLWEAGCVAYMSVLKSAAMREDILGKCVLELGAGIGILTSAYFAAGAKAAVLTDNDDAVLEALRENVRQYENFAHVEHLDFEDISCVNMCATRHSVDTVVAADVCYDPDLTTHVVRAIEEILGAEQGRRRVAYLFVTRRGDDCERALRKAILEAAMDCEQVPVAVETPLVENSSFGVMLRCREDWDFCKVRLYRFT